MCLRYSLVIVISAPSLWVRFAHVTIHVLFEIQTDNQHVVYRAEKYGSVYRVNIFHYVVLCVTSPEATKVNTGLDNDLMCNLELHEHCTVNCVKVH